MMTFNNSDKVLLIMLLILISSGAIAQSSFPKDTIYVKYVTNKKENRKIIDWEHRGEKGIYFSIRDHSHELYGRNKFISLFYPYSQPTDTLPINQITNYHFSNLKEIDEKQYRWVFDHDRLPLRKSQIFKTYLIEKISEDCFVKYPVIWRNEGGGF